MPATWSVSLPRKVSVFLTRPYCCPDDVLIKGSLRELLRRGTWAKGSASTSLAIPKPWWASGMSMSPAVMGIPASFGISLFFPGSGDEKSNLLGSL